uniref:Uncharacterized protein n=1 Tax=Glossina austeni TaxID=7395 RepID=A0A1A9UDY8_GLOAU
MILFFIILCHFVNGLIDPKPNANCKCEYLMQFLLGMCKCDERGAKSITLSFSNCSVEHLSRGPTPTYSVVTCLCFIKRKSERVMLHYGSVFPMLQHLTFHLISFIHMNDHKMIFAFTMDRKGYKFEKLLKIDIF